MNREEELIAENEALRAEREAWKETAAMHFDAEQAFLSWLRQAGEHMRAEGITVCDDGQDCGEILTAKVPECAALLKQRADAAEAEAARLRAEAEKIAAQRDEAILRAEVAERAKRAVEADLADLREVMDRQDAAWCKRVDALCARIRAEQKEQQP